MLWFIITLVVVAAIVIYCLIPGGKLKEDYLSEVKVSLSETKHSEILPILFTDSGISELPTLLQRHIVNGGYLNKPLMNNMLIHFHNTKFCMSPDSKPMDIEYVQVNSVKRPDRLAFLTGRLAGIPLNAKDSLLDGKGSMTVTLAKLFQLFQVTGAEMDQAQLITVLADAVYMPSLFLQSFVTWKELDDYTVEGTVSWKDVSAKGRFSFDEYGNIVRFDTDDRYMDEKGKGLTPTPWFVTYSDYKEQIGYFQPCSISVNWSLPDKVDNYFVSNNIEIQYSVDKVETL